MIRMAIILTILVTVIKPIYLDSKLYTAQAKQVLQLSYLQKYNLQSNMKYFQGTRYNGIEKFKYNLRNIFDDRA